MYVYRENECLYTAVEEADSFLSRFRGLMLRKALLPEEGLLLRRCGRVHTNFMRFPIDVIYLDREGRVLDRETLRPWRLGKRVKGAVDTLEVAAGRGARLQRGDRLTAEEKERNHGIYLC